MSHDKRSRNREWGARTKARGKYFTRLKPRADKANGVRVMPGGYYVTEKPDEVIITILGSCVAACIHDPKLGIGGMNHFMLPELPSEEFSPVSEAMRFGSHAMEVLINELLASGCKRERLEVKVFGGADLRSVSQITSGIGTNNARFVMDYLKRENMNVISHDLGGNLPRRIHFYPADGKIKLLLLEKPEVEKVAQEEKLLQRKIGNKPTKKVEDGSEDGGVEFF